LSAHYFVADAHLGAGRVEAEQRLLRFLVSLKGRADSLYILGDLFEFWLEYGAVIPKRGFAALARLAELRDGGTRLVYLKGNHDFWFKDFFRRELGVESVHDHLEAVVDGRRVFLCHGDELDRGFVPRFFRMLMRSRVNGALYSLIHPDIGMGFARWVAGRSRAGGPKLHLLEDMARFAQVRIDAGCDVVMMAHSHVPEVRRLGRGVYVNIGDWLTSFTYGVIRNGVVSLERFEAGPG
jgi:UDP-2,3-diacylglucosamine hydrolase